MKNLLRPLAAMLLLLAGGPAALSQVTIPVLGTQTLINGYSRTLGGETISYFSVYPKYARQALLTRCAESPRAIEWETDTIPATLRGEYAYFTWIAAHSTGTSGGDRNFDLYLNGEKSLSFTTHAKNYPPYWTFGGPDSTRMVFEFKTRDGALDAHGMVYLRVPLSKYKPGRPLKIKIIGQQQNSQDWYMTFQYSFKEKVDLTPLPFVLRSALNNERPVQVTVLHFGAPQKLQLSIRPDIRRQFDLSNGFNVFEIPVPLSREKIKLPVSIRIGDNFSQESQIELAPIVYREIDLIHHAHTDIGYSHIQEDVIRIHNENIRQALDLIDKTRDYPEGSRFRWNIESAWVVENFLQVATAAEKQRFVKALKNREIALSGTYANILTGLCTPEEMYWITDYARGLRDSLGLVINTGMMSDIPGMSWSMVPALARSGIRYFSNGPNFMDNMPDRGDRIGHTLLEQGDRPFWWKSTSGRDSILMWTCAKGYSSWHGFPPGGVTDRGAEKIAQYLDELSAGGYPYEMVQWRYNIVSDNGPTDSSISGFVRNWNLKYSSPKLVLANVSEFFERFEKQYGNRLPVLQGDWTPYWEDGAYSTAREEAAVRLLSEKLTLLENYARQNHRPLDPHALYEAKKNVVLFHEHTWGSWNSISDPDNPFSVHQWRYKKGFGDSAAFYTAQIEAALRTPAADSARITVYNTLSWARDGYAEFSPPAGRGSRVLKDGAGRLVPFQKLANGRICFIASGVPANGSNSYHFVPGSGNPKTGPFPAMPAFDSLTGALRAVNYLNRQWVAAGPFKGLLQAVYVRGLDPAQYSLSKLVKLELLESGPVFRKYRATCSLEGCTTVIYEYTQYRGLGRLDLSVSIDKSAIRDKESLHLAFPFDIKGAKLRIGMDDSFIMPDSAQIRGANKDFFCEQRWLDVSGTDYGVTLSSVRGALFEVGSMINEVRSNNGYKKWKDSATADPLIFLYALNNYWHTNYKADQPGWVSFDFKLGFHGNFQLSKARQFGYEATQPLIVAGEK